MEKDEMKAFLIEVIDEIRDTDKIRDKIVNYIAQLEDYVEGHIEQQENMNENQKLISKGMVSSSESVITRLKKIIS